MTIFALHNLNLQLLYKQQKENIKLTASLDRAVKNALILLGLVFAVKVSSNSYKHLHFHAHIYLMWIWVYLGVGSKRIPFLLLKLKTSQKTCPKAMETPWNLIPPKCLTTSLIQTLLPLHRKHFHQYHNLHSPLQIKIRKA